MAFSNYLPALERRIQHAVNQVLSWTMNNGVTISQSKTVGIHFHRKREHVQPNIYIQRRMVIFRPTVKFLGMIFDQKLTWKDILQLKESCTYRLGLLRTISHSNWGADRAPCFDYIELL